ncbi:shikimate dehydrogenase [Lentibacillus cibarius]|uniref:Shikimate dehydrogenase (NADP(+)) n=1 Tax=Lentibacillus cibarius TaxID=2583219 RepID=A0A549YLK3_9BACI|nr:shikimate dehydrogenase [Lentibacillus cibarius]TRM12769.1 shikimate dehydrogenase [Lentibacillus cibarius]
MQFRLGLIGHPIQHSLSPWIHNQFLEKSGLTGTYSLIEITPEDSFTRELEKLKSSGLHGFNVTVPYKQKIIPYLDQLEWKAEVTGAVNTVVNQNGKWVGYNTDGTGYVRGLKEQYPSVFEAACKVLIIGAGGAARGIYQALIAEGLSYIDIANRTTESAEAIAQKGSDGVQTNVLGLQEAEEVLGHYNLIIQTTAVGMKPNTEEQIISLEQLNEDSIVSDIIYQPLTTKFLQTARRKGAHVHYGHTMLLYQAQYAFQLWTSYNIPIGDLKQQLKTLLEGR